MIDVVLVTPPASEPLALIDVKSQCRVYFANDDDYLTNVIMPAARDAIECELSRVLVTQTWLFKMDGFPGVNPAYESHGYPEIILPKPPCQSIGKFTYVDTAGVLQTLYPCLSDGTTPTINGEQQYYGYQFDPGSETQPARLLPPWARPWPPSRRMPMAVQITFTCGYGALAPAGSPLVPTWQPSPIPPAIYQAMLLQANHLYTNREAVSSEGGKELARGVSSLLSYYVNRIA